MTTTRFASAVIVGIAVLVVVVFAGLISASATSGTLVILVDTTLTEDHNGNIEVNADNVTLDCDGHSITEPEPPTGSVGIMIENRDGVTVRNCTVIGFDAGIRVFESTDTTLDGNHAMEAAGAGFLLENADNNTLIRNEATDNNHGFSLNSSSSNVLSHNTSFGGEDFILQDSSDHNTLLWNVAVGDPTRPNFDELDSFFLGGSSHNSLEHNSSFDAGKIGYRLDGPAQFNQLVENTAEGAATNGFEAQDVASDNTLTGNASHRNAEFGFVDFLVPGSNSYLDNICIENVAGGSSPEGLCDERGTFTDDDGSIFEFSIEWLAQEGITQGCNPPTNTMFCPDDFVTRGEMAVFLVRALDYTDNGGGDLFIDDDGLFYENSADRLKTAKVTLGCNPPTNNKYCGESHVTRGQMAAFLVRAMGYVDNGGGDLFADDDGHIFENAIDKLGTAKVTLGCNPPTNDKFCPDDKVTRGQMAAFLKRALG